MKELLLYDLVHIGLVLVPIPILLLRECTDHYKKYNYAYLKVTLQILFWFV